MSMLMTQQFLSAALEIIINQALSLNMNNNTLHTLKEKTLSVYLDELGFSLLFHINDSTQYANSEVNQVKTARYINVLTHNGNNDISDELVSDCSIRTSLKTLWQLKQEQQLTELIKKNKLDLQGDIKVAQQFASIVDNINIDWQSELAKHIGDIPTYQLGQFGQWLKSKGEFATSQISADASEWLIHEKHLLVTQYELNRFHQSVTTLDNDTKNLTERLARLTALINQ